MRDDECWTLCACGQRIDAADPDALNVAYSEHSGIAGSGGRAAAVAVESIRQACNRRGCDLVRNGNSKACALHRDLKRR